MCRLLFVRSNYEFNIEEHLKQFASIAKNSKEFQGHGWGCSFILDDEWVHYKNIKPVWEDDLSRFGTTTRLIAHARSAFKDKDIVVENNMPFSNEEYVFIFNGELRGVKIKEEGRIGAEKIFNFIMRFYQGDMEEALAKAVEQIKLRTSYVRAMNIIIADQDYVFVSANHNEDPDYFTMHMKMTEESMIICSEAYPGESGWEKIQNNFTGMLV